MTNYIARLFQHTVTVIQNKVHDGVAWEISDFKELVQECEKQRIDRRKTRGLVLDILNMLPRLDKDGRKLAWADISEAYLPKKEYTVSKINLETASDEAVAAHLAKVFAAKFKEMTPA